MKKNNIEDIFKELMNFTDLDEATTTGNIDGYLTPNAFSRGTKKEKDRMKKMTRSLGYTELQENRWLQIKNDETMSDHKKMALGLKDMKYKLNEIEKFLGWYNRLKTIKEIDSESYWKRTNRHISNMKEKVVHIAKLIQELEK